MSYCVLIVDDSKLARMAIAKALIALQPDWVRVEAANAEEAITLISRHAVDIALLDFNMPGRDGLALATELRAMDSAMPMAIISANMQDEIVARAHAVGAAFLPKPLTQPALEAFLSDVRQKLKTLAR